MIRTAVRMPLRLAPALRRSDGESDVARSLGPVGDLT